MSVVGALRVIGICCVLFSACGRQKPPPPAAMREISTWARAPVDAAVGERAVDSGAPRQPNNELPWAANTLDMVEAVEVSVLGKEVRVDDVVSETIPDE